MRRPRGSNYCWQPIESRKLCLHDLNLYWIKWALALFVLVSSFCIFFCARLSWKYSAFESALNSPVVSYHEKSIGRWPTKMNDFDLWLEVVSRSCQPLCYIRFWISRKPLEIEDWLNLVPKDKKWHMWYQSGTWPRQVKLVTRLICFSAIYRKQLEMLFSNNR